MIQKIRYILEAFLLILILIFSKAMPVTWASGFGGWIGRTIGPRLAASRKAMANISKIYPDKTKEEKQKILNGMWDNLGRVIMEYPHLKTIGRDRTEIVNIEDIKSYIGKAVIFISGHFGNWECCPPAILLQLNYFPHPIYRAPNNPFSDWLLRKARQVGGKLSPIPKSKAGMRSMVNVLKEGNGIGLVIDQKYNEGIEVDFMGHPAMTSSVFAQLAQKFDCPIVPLHIERLNGPNFRITVLPPLKTNERSVIDIVKDSHIILEEWVHKNPEQWLWLHRRWKET
jgi:KDO2-lipid IV(A) lauroyltransferase